MIVDYKKAEYDGLNVPDILKMYEPQTLSTAFFNKEINGKPVWVSVQFPKELEIEDIVVFTRDEIITMLRKEVESQRGTQSFLIKADS
jgi:hypothetical protein